MVPVECKLAGAAALSPCNGFFFPSAPPADSLTTRGWFPFRTLTASTHTPPAYNSLGIAVAISFSDAVWTVCPSENQNAPAGQGAVLPTEIEWGYQMESGGG